MEKVKKTEDKQNLKRSRVKAYFLDAAREMITSEGVESISVRKVADAAGYSYATLYTYFADVNELLWDVKQVMINDLVVLIQEKMRNVILDTDGIKRLFRNYVAYYFENPNVFKFFYFHKLDRPGKKPEETSAEPDFSVMMKETFKGFVLEGKLCETDIEIVAKTCIYAVHGMLTLFFTENGDMTEESVYKELDGMVDYLL